MSENIVRISSKIGAMLGLMSGSLFALNHDSIAIFLFLLAVLFFSIDIALHCIADKNKHPEERKILLTACLKIIDARTRLTVENIGEFRDTFKQYRYSFTREQKFFVGSLLSAVGDVRINNEELTGLGVCKERAKLLSDNSSLLDKIEKSLLVIEEFLNQT